MSDEMYMDTKGQEHGSPEKNMHPRETSKSGTGLDAGRGKRSVMYHKHDPSEHTDKDQGCDHPAATAPVADHGKIYLSHRSGSK